MPAVSKVPGFTRHELRFCDEYLIDLRADLAAVRAGYSERSAKELGYQQLKKPHIAERIAQLMQDRERRTRIKAHRVLEELATVALSSIDDYVIDDDGRVQLAEGAPEDAMRAVSSIKRKVKTYTMRDEPVTEIETEIRLWDKPSTLRTALQHLGALIERHEHSGPNGAPLTMKLTSEERRARIDAIMGKALARRAASATNGHNGNGSHA
ncbi:MAG TPA: terminase small subunit [Gemmatimonadales bacterium]|nr:terminase small subunit [Gemmatimonadales bacterium]